VAISEAVRIITDISKRSTLAAWKSLASVSVGQEKYLKRKK
jgi:hypothetical protein